jgi:hypothetical protein
MGNLLRQAQEMQRELDRVREELRTTVVEGNAGAGAVRVEVTGDRRVIKVELSDEAASSNDKAALEDLILAALRDGIQKAATLAEERVAGVTGGMQLPGLF